MQVNPIIDCQYCQRQVKFSLMNGWHFHTDGIHLNSRAGMILVDLEQDFLDR